MKTVGWIAVVAVAVLGGWWLWSRRRVAVGYGARVPAPPGGYVNPNDVLSAPGLNGGTNWKDATAATVGAINAVGVSTICSGYGGDPRACQLAGKVSGKVAEYGTKGTIKVVEKVGSVSKKALKAIIPGW